eukprot:m.126002 g.126002  ORF g.126002 m.126002 type:complete len:526 (+) comp16669_c0_seq2:214-1791(+)
MAHCFGRRRRLPWVLAGLVVVVAVWFLAVAPALLFVDRRRGGNDATDRDRGVQSDEGNGRRHRHQHSSQRTADAPPLAHGQLGRLDGIHHDGGGVVVGAQSVGCYTDVLFESCPGRQPDAVAVARSPDDDLRSNTEQQQSSAGVSPLACATACWPYKYAVLAFGTACCCTDTLEEAHLAPRPALCNLPCAQGTNTQCGGFFAQSIYTPVLAGEAITNVGTQVQDPNDGATADPVHVMICSDGSRLFGLLAAIKSVLSNTKSRVVFHLVTDSATAVRLETVLKRTLPAVKAEVIAFNASWVENRIQTYTARKELKSPLNYARFFLQRLFPDLHGRLIFLDDDVIVQGDVLEMSRTDLGPHAIAVSEDCNWIFEKYHLFMNKLDGFINFENKHVQALGLDPSACSFNAGVFVVDLDAWRAMDADKHLLHWLTLNTKEVVYGNKAAGGGSQPPMLIVFHKRYAHLDPLWHVRLLGSRFGGQMPAEFVRDKAKLLHWNGASKPWRTTPSTNPQFDFLYQRHAVKASVWW